MPPKPNPRPPLTHFLCLPLITQNSRPFLSKSLQEFRNAALFPTTTSIPTNNLSPGSAEVSHGTTDSLNARVSEQAIRPLGTLHLTLGVMSLQTQERVDAVGEILKGLDFAAMLTETSGPEPLGGGEGGRSTVTNTHAENQLAGPADDGIGAGLGARESVAPLMVSLRGLKSMQASNKTSILHIEPRDSTNRLEGFCRRLKEVFQNAGLMLEDGRPLKSHATVLNTVYANQGHRRRKRPTEDGDDGHGLAADGGGQAAPVREGGTRLFDARDLLDRFRDYEWVGEVRLERVAVCRMGAKKIRNAEGEVVDERYEEVFGWELP